MVLEKTLESPLDIKESNQSILKEINTEYSLEGLILKLKLQYFRHLIRMSRLIGKGSDAGKNWGKEEKGAAEDETVNGIRDLMDMSLSKLQEMVKDKEAWRTTVHRVAESRESHNWVTEW